MIEMNVEEIYDANKSVPDSLRPNEPRFTSNRYSFFRAYLVGHKIGIGNSFPRVNPTQEDFSRLVKELKKAGLKF
ncbi:MAG: hypothetical protein AABW47_01630 [Nanoarchaeota archaeon]